ncbi:MAG: hypothetical protein ACXW4M_13455 [Anaerolineales bacterium]
MAKKLFLDSMEYAINVARKFEYRFPVFYDLYISEAGIKTTEFGTEHYISLRAESDRYITLLAPKFAYDMDEIDTALEKAK